MSSMVCQGNQSCFEPIVFEPCGLKHTFNQPKPHQWPQVPLILKEQNEHKENPCNQGEFDNNNNSSNNFDHEKNNNSDVGAWNFIQSLPNKNEQVKHDGNVYVHPLVKKTSSVLSLKSLEMCTESLGSETGRDTSETSDEVSFHLSLKTNEEYHQMWRLKYEKITKKVSGKNNFPPPLTSITDSENIQVTPSRKGGRLVLKASVYLSNPYFQTERVDGRLRLFFVEGDDVEIDGDCEQQEEEDEEDDDDDDDDDDDIWDEDMGTERPMPRRCKQGGHENKAMPNWKPCLVTNS